MKDTIISQDQDTTHILYQKLNEIKQRILAAKLSPYTSKEELLNLTDQLAQGQLGKYLILNRKIDGFWTDVIVTYPFHHRLDVNFTNLERHLIEDCPIGIAIRERFQIYKRVLQSLLEDQIAITSISCGFMRDVLGLDYSNIQKFSLMGIDEDQECLHQAQAIAQNYQLTSYCDFVRQDSLQLDQFKQVDVIVSDSLSIYDNTPEQVNSLFKQFYQHLKPNGTLLVSYFSHPPLLDQTSDWDLSQIDPNYIFYQKKLLNDILQVNWPHYTTEKEVANQLQEAGFHSFKVIHDSLRVFPTIVAKKF